ncbi:MAG: GGDEF domain-containing protein [Aquificae bacterium]|nr:GGDEF domain-containing protein [Aquificota bacterium]
MRRGGDFRKLFLLTLFVPYAVVFLLSAYLFTTNLSKLGELKTVQELAEPIDRLSRVVVLLNHAKVLKVAPRPPEFPEADDPVAELERELLLLKEKLFQNPHWVEYCNCWDLLKFDERILELVKKPFLGTEELRELGRYANLLNAYYVNLSLRLKQAAVAEVFKNFYFLHRLLAVGSDFVAENALFLEGRLQNFYYEYYYLQGLFRANLDAYFALLTDDQLKELFKRELLQAPLIRTFLSGFYRDAELLLTDYSDFVGRFWEYRCRVFGEAKGWIEAQVGRLQLELALLFTVGLVLAALLVAFHLRLYKLGLENLNRLLAEVRLRSARDPLTGLFNRRLFNEYLLKRVRELYRNGEKVSLVLLDLDDFKRINDLYGHPFGDEVLRRVARLLRTAVREGDAAFRWGGEEFAVFVRGDRAAALSLAERLRRKLEETTVNGVKVTASFGVAEYSGEEPKEFFQKADRALYEAKRKGKNRVEVAD